MDGYDVPSNSCMLTVTVHACQGLTYNLAIMYLMLQFGKRLHYDRLKQTGLKCCLNIMFAITADRCL